MLVALAGQFWANWRESIGSPIGDVEQLASIRLQTITAKIDLIGESPDAMWVIIVTGADDGLVLTIA